MNYLKSYFLRTQEINFEAYESLSEILKTSSNQEIHKFVVQELRSMPTEERCSDLLWLCAQKLNYPEFYKAWHGKSTIHPEIAEISAVGHTSDTENLNRQLLPELLKQLTVSDRSDLISLSLTLSEQQSESTIAKRVGNRIFSQVNEVPPSIEDIGDLEQALFQLCHTLEKQKLIVLLYNTEPYPNLVSLCNQLADIVTIAWICESPIESISIRTFHPDSDNLHTALQTWLQEIA